MVPPALLGARMSQLWNSVCNDPKGQNISTLESCLQRSQRPNTFRLWNRVLQRSQRPKHYDIGIVFAAIPKAKAFRLWNRVCNDPKGQKHFDFGIVFATIPKAENISTLESCLQRFQWPKTFRLWNRVRNDSKGRNTF